MALGARELLVLLRAKDQASRVIAGVGQSLGSLGKQGGLTAGQMTNIGTALIGAGTVIGGIGVLALGWLNSATDAAISYNKQAALTKTQIDDTRISVGQLRDLGLRIAKEFPVNFDSIQKSLYDIFSSMDVSLADAGKLITAFAKASVGGQVDIQAAGRTTIAIMNAWKIPVKDVNKVLDLQFQLVRKGVGTYEEFNSNIGKSIPSALRAGQSFSTLAGMLAFMTRNGLNVAMASTSAARALDAMANPTVAKRLDAMGISIKDAHGNFRPMVDILGQMNEKFKGLTKPELAKKLQDLFKGAGGTIQARRFFDLVFQNFDEFKARVGEMGGSAGQLQSAFNTMMGTEANKAQLLQNRYQALKIQIGEQLIPAKLRLMEILTKILGWWDKLSPSTQRAIVQTVAITAAIMVVVGVMLVLMGTIAVLIGSLMFMGLAFGTAAALVGVFILALIAIPIIIFIIIKWHKQIADTIGRVWTWLGEKVGAFRYVLLLLAIAFGMIIAPILVFIAVVSLVIKYHEQLVDAAKAVWKWMQSAWDAIYNAVTNAWDSIKPIWDDIYKFLTDTLPGALETFVGWMQTAWDTVKNIVGAAWSWIDPKLQAFADWFGTYITPLLQAFGDLFAAIWGRVQDVLDIASQDFDYVKGVIEGFFSYLTPLIQIQLQIGWLLGA